MDSRSQRWLGIAGIVFVALVLANSLISGKAPGSHASAASVVSFYHAHRPATLINVFIIEAAVIEGLWFFWYLRQRLGEDSSAKALANVGFAGVLVLAVGGALGGGVNYALYDAVNHVSPTVMQTLSVARNDLIRVGEAPGTGLFLIATGLALVRTNVLPRWLGWIGMVLGVASAVLFTGGLGADIWVLIASIVLLTLAGRRSATTQA